MFLLTVHKVLIFLLFTSIVIFCFEWFLIMMFLFWVVAILISVRRIPLCCLCFWIAMVDIFVSSLKTWLLYPCIPPTHTVFFLGEKSQDLTRSARMAWNHFRFLPLSPPGAGFISMYCHACSSLCVHARVSTWVWGIFPWEPSTFCWNRLSYLEPVFPWLGEDGWSINWASACLQFPGARLEVNTAMFDFYVRSGIQLRSSWWLLAGTSLLAELPPPLPPKPCFLHFSAIRFLMVGLL